MTPRETAMEVETVSEARIQFSCFSGNCVERLVQNSSIKARQKQLTQAKKGFNNVQEIGRLSAAKDHRSPEHPSNSGFRGHGSGPRLREIGSFCQVRTFSAKPRDNIWKGRQLYDHRSRHSP